MLIVGAAVATGAFVFLPFATSTDALAKQVVETCRESDKRYACYEHEIPVLLDKGLSMEEAFKVVREVQELDPTYHYCHVTAHLISEKETAKDLSKWKDVIARAPAGICGNGALHGAFQERFRKESWPEATMDELRSEFSGVCDPRAGWDPTFLERASCMHGLGHLSMYVTNANIERSVELCSELAYESEAADFRRTCTDGAFMQIYQPLEPDDEDLVAELIPVAEKADTFCARFEGIARTSCIKESWPLVRDSLRTPEGAGSFCARLHEEDEYRYCASGLIYVVMGLLEYDANKMMSLCKTIPEKMRDQCVASTASRFIETDWRNIPQSLAVCEDAPSENKEACYAELIRFADQGLPRGSEEAQALCDGMPVNWARQCAGRVGLTL